MAGPVSDLHHITLNNIQDIWDIVRTLKNSADYGNFAPGAGPQYRDRGQGKE